MKLEDRIKETHKQKNKMVTELQQFRRAVTQTETAVIKLIGKIEGLEEELADRQPKKKEKVNGAK